MSLPSNTNPLSQRTANSPRRYTPGSSRRYIERNTEEAHQEALEEAKRHHARIYDLALLTLETYNYDQLKAENELAEQRVLQAERAAAEAVKARELAERNAAAEAKRAAQLKEQATVDAQKAKDLQEQAAAAAASEASRADVVAAKTQLEAAQASTPANTNGHTQPEPEKPTTVAPSITDSQNAPSTATLPTASQLQNPVPAPQPTSIPTSTPNGISNPPLSLQQSAIQPSKAQPTTSSSPNPYLCPDEARLVEIHQNCKKMRAYMKSLCDEHSQIRTKAGAWRRIVRMSVGQLTGGETDQKANNIQLQKVSGILNEALENRVCPTPMMTVDDFVIGKRDPVQGASNNDQLPVMFMFLLNHFAKSIINQLALEAGSKPLNALSVGIFAVRIFALPEYLWRGKSLIDILIAKFRVVCPSLFGIRLDDTTDSGRAQIGWKKSPDGKWVSEELHVTRIAGLAAGYAAICLRDFSKSTRLVHPYGVWNYWKAVVGIIGTPAAEFSKTQGYVLKSLIDNYEKKFVGFYGSAAVEVLRQVTVVLPRRFEAGAQNDATLALGALATKMKHDLGVDVKRTFAV